MSDIYIVGIDMIPFARNSGRTAAQLGAAAALLALDDCGLADPADGAASRRACPGGINPPAR